MKKNKYKAKKTTEKKYGRDFGVRSDKKLGNYLKEQGYPSLSKLVKKNEKKQIQS